MLQVVFVEVAAGVDVAGVVGVDGSDTEDGDAHLGLQLQDALHAAFIPHGRLGGGMVEERGHRELFHPGTVGAAEPRMMSLA